MRKLLLAVATTLALASGAHADAVNNLSFGVLPNPVPQSASAPCIICATQQVHNPVGFGFNDFVNTGGSTNFNLFSSNITGAFANGDDINVTPYTGGQLRTFLQGLGDVQLTFGVAVDINTAGGPNGDAHYLELFQLINLDAAPGERIIFDLRNVAMPVIDNGNGKADYLIGGFDLSNVNIGDRLLFRAQWSGASDGGESFYIVPNLQLVPGPVVGAGLLPLAACVMGLFGFNYFRRKRVA